MSNPQQQWPMGETQAMHQHEPRPAPRNGLGTAALVLGIIGFVLGLIPFVGLFGFICGLVGLALGIGGIVRANKGGATNRTMAIIGTILCAITVVVSMMVWSAAASAISAAVAPGTVTAVNGGAAAAPGQAPATPQSRFAAGQTADVEGLQLTSTPLRKKSQQYGSALLCTDVTYLNNSAESARFSITDWHLQSPQGAVKDMTLGLGIKSLDSGELRPGGGTITGTVCFEDPGTKGNYLVLFKPMFSLNPTQVEWATKV